MKYNQNENTRRVKRWRRPNNKRWRFVLTTEQEIDYAFYDLDHENYYLNSIDVYQNPYKKIILHIELIHREREFPNKLSSFNAKAINRSYWLRLTHHKPTFKTLPFEAQTISEYYNIYKKYLNGKMIDGDLDAMVLLAEYLYEDKTDESIATSKQYLETASQHGHAYTSYLLAKRNRMVLSPPADKFWMDNREENCKYYLTLSAEQGNRSALYYLGV